MSTMTDATSRLSGHGLDRRAALRLGTGLGAAGLALVFLAPAASARPWERLGAARKVIGDAPVATEGLELELPLVSEDGSSIPLTVRAASPMTADDHVSEIHLFAAANPTPEIATFRLSPLAGRAQIMTRIRLNESQTVIAIARTSAGKLLAAARDVRVTVSGCMMRADAGPAVTPMQARVRAPQRARKGEPAEVLTLINHPMETGLRRDAQGELIPQRIIETFEASMDGAPALSARLYRSLAANPYIRFFIAPQTSGELSLRWREDSGRTAEHSASIAVTG